VSTNPFWATPRRWLLGAAVGLALWTSPAWADGPAVGAGAPLVGGEIVSLVDHETIVSAYEITPFTDVDLSCCACGPVCNRWYVTLSGGWQERETVRDVGDAQTFTEFNSGFLANTAIGYQIDAFRVEAESSFVNNDVDQAGAGGLSSGASGNINLRALMFNFYHDFAMWDWCWEPYLGAGLGIYQSEINGLYPEFFNAVGPPFEGSPVNATSNMPLAYQFRAGVSRPVGRRTEFFSGYRFFRGEELEFSSAPFASAADPTFHPDGAKIHSFELGLRVGF